MKFNKGLIACALFALSICVLCKIVVWVIQSDPQTFGRSAFAILPKLQVAIEVGLIVAIGLVCFGLLGGQPASRY